MVKGEVAGAMGLAEPGWMPGSQARVGDSHSSQTEEAGWMGVHIPSCATTAAGRSADAEMFSIKA